MWFFLFRRVRRWILLTIVVPLIGLASHKAAERIERREGRPTKVSKGLRQVGRFTGRQPPAQRQTQRSIDPPDRSLRPNNREL